MDRAPSFNLVTDFAGEECQRLDEGVDVLRQGLLASSTITGHNDDKAQPAAQSSSSSKVSATTLTINLVTATLGTGILSLPYATAGASLIGGACITCFVMALNVWTNMILVRAANRVKVFDLGGVLGRLPGRCNRVARALCDVSIWVSVLLCLVSYLIVVADSLELLLPELCRTYRVVLGGLVAFPLSFLDQAKLAFSSSLSIAANIYLFVLLLSSPAAHEDSGNQTRCVFGMGHGGITMVSALMQAAIVQMCVLPMYEQLERRSPERFAGCAIAGFGFVTLLFIVFSSVGYLLYGATVSSNVLQDLPIGLGGDIARIAMAVAVLGVYPIMVSSMIAPIRHAEQRAARHHVPLMIPSPPYAGSPPPSAGASPWTSPPGSPMLRQLSQPSPPGSPWPPLPISMTMPPGASTEMPLNQSYSNGSTDGSAARAAADFAKRCRGRIHRLRWSKVATSGVVLCSIAGANMTDSLGYVNIVNGALQVSALIALVPSTVGFFLLGRVDFVWRCAMAVLLCSGLVVSALGFKYTSNGADDLMKHCMWSISW